MRKAEKPKRTSDEKRVMLIAVMAWPVNATGIAEMSADTK
jgi:hypothetical protein